ncbi:alpha/beta hydrolase family protein [Microbacterium trichothecenolyticum]|uniref:Prolyl oligopeptidase PreP (S9A serine peptidase family) n=1 Tax=Microbacterium trichothecenolyticum TaxID=69370 RepID=A0ABU0TQZ2_MICTR|nr:prolyl oligopeptidase family serine peptidase [Microbacterium trichothecenolyticum]MDQ1122088.1 prolyl oligopeptidase PreP (S9A serine peptidase family) [Microbacterium trichothecenolyticum]
MHGGFGLSLQPVSGISDRADDLDMLFAHVRGGGELGSGWASAGRGQRKRQALDDIGAVVRHESACRRTVSLMGTSHGGWLALLCALRHPSLIDRVCVTSPITHLPAYLRSDMGRKHRAEFPPEDVLDQFDPMTRIARATGVVPDLMIVHGAADTTVPNQDPEAFAAAWRRAGGRCRIVRHSGGHYGPTDGEAPRIVREQRSFVGVDA